MDEKRLNEQLEILDSLSYSELIEELDILSKNQLLEFTASLFISNNKLKLIVDKLRREMEAIIKVGYYPDEIFKPLTDRLINENIRRKKLKEAGLNGARSRHSKSRELKAWAEQEAKAMNGADLDIARRLAAGIPEHLADASKNPERLIYDHLRALRNTAS